MWVICLNDYPIATASTKELAEEARDKLQALYDTCQKESEPNSYFCRQYHIHIHEVPEILPGSMNGQYLRVFLQNCGNNYTHILRRLNILGDMKEMEAEFKGKICSPNCQFMIPSEDEQGRMGANMRHWCRKYEATLFHRDAHPKLYRCQECIDEQHAEWRKLVRLFE